MGRQSCAMISCDAAQVLDDARPAPRVQEPQEKAHKDAKTRQNYSITSQ